MVRGIWVEELEDEVERTEVLKTELKTHGHRLPSNELVNLLRERKLDEKLINRITSRRVCVIGPHQTPTMIAVGMMRLNGEYGFYFSILKTESSGCPEMRFIIENDQEFGAWFDCFVKELSYHPIGIQPPGLIEEEKQVKEVAGIADDRMKKVYQKLWGIECKLEELISAHAEAEIDEEESKEYASKFADLEMAFSKVINFIARKKGISTLPTVLIKEDVEKILLWETSKARDAFAKEYVSWLAKQKERGKGKINL